MDLRVSCEGVGQGGIVAALQDHVHRRVMFVLRHRRERLASVDVRIAPLRSRRLAEMALGHGCRVEVELLDGERLTQFEIDSDDVFAAADRAVDRIGARVDMHLNLHDAPLSGLSTTS